jgi:hypothetical protein
MLGVAREARQRGGTTARIVVDMDVAVMSR